MRAVNGAVRRAGGVPGARRVPIGPGGGGGDDPPACAFGPGHAQLINVNGRFTRSKAFPSFYVSRQLSRPSARRSLELTRTHSAARAIQPKASLTRGQRRWRPLRAPYMSWAQRCVHCAAPQRPVHGSASRSRFRHNKPQNTEPLNPKP